MRYKKKTDGRGKGKEVGIERGREGKGEIEGETKEGRRRVCEKV